MSKEIKAIQTYYNGYWYRSRLEARWAVFFDAAGIKYVYEPEGFVGFDGSKYLPDFYLPVEDIYVEVKGCDEKLEDDWSKIANAIDFGATPVSKGLLLLGEIPNPESFEFGTVPLFSFLYRNEGIVCDYATFEKGKIVYGEKAIADMLVNNDKLLIDYCDCFEEHVPKVVTTAERWYFLARYRLDVIADYYKKARTARFEFGERP